MPTRHHAQSTQRKKVHLNHMYPRYVSPYAVPPRDCGCRSYSSATGGAADQVHNDGGTIHHSKLTALALKCNEPIHDTARATVCIHYNHCSLQPQAAAPTLRPLPLLRDVKQSPLTNPGLIKGYPHLPSTVVQNTTQALACI
jgi:hypothetical protein